MSIDISTGRITFPVDFCQFVNSTTDFSTKVFPNITPNHDWLSKRTENINITDLNFKIRSEIAIEFMTYKSMDPLLNKMKSSTIQPRF